MTCISETTGTEMGAIAMQEIFVFKQEDFDDAHRVKGTFVATGAIPRFFDGVR